MNDDLISLSEAKKLGATCLARRNENGQLEAIISLDNAPTVEQNWRFYYDHGYKQAERDLKRPKGEWKETGYETGALGITYRQTQCSNCGWEHALPMWWNFCPNCGAEMGKESEE